MYVMSDTGWKAVTGEPEGKWRDVGFDDSGWDVELASLGKLGVDPW